MNHAHLTTPRIKAALESVGLLDRVYRRANVFNMIRAGEIRGAIGILMAGEGLEKIRATVTAFNTALSSSRDPR